MPRRKAADRNVPTRRRSRTGCITCRTRKIKCDENKPRCSNCIARNLSCDQKVQLKWESDFADRGAAFGRQGIWNKQQRRSSYPESVPSPVLGESLTIRPHHFVNTLSTDLNPDLSGQEELWLPDTAEQPWDSSIGETPNQPSDTNLSLVPSLTTARIPVIQTIEFDPSLLDYYFHRICSFTSTTPSTKSPFADLILPLFSSGSQNPVQLSVAALSARHRSLQDPKWVQAAMSLKGQVIKMLRERLTLASEQPAVAWDSQTFVVMMFLCLYEIIDNCDQRWVIHLRASQDLVRKKYEAQSLIPYRPCPDDNLGVFAERFFAFQDIISRTACGNPPLFKLEYWQRLADGTTDGPIERADGSDFGTMLYRITELSRAHRLSEISEGEFFAGRNNLREDISSPSSDWTLLSDDPIRRRAEIRQASMKLYFLCLLHNGSPTHPQVIQIVHDLLPGIRDLVREGHFSELGFPLFLAAVELDPLNDEIPSSREGEPPIYGRRLILELLESIYGFTFLNIARLSGVIQKVWKMRDLNASDGTMCSGSTLIGQDWNTFVRPYSSNLSLS